MAQLRAALAVAVSLTLLFRGATAGPLGYNSCYLGCRSAVKWYFMGGGGAFITYINLKTRYPGASWSSNLVCELCYTMCIGLVASPNP